MVVPELANRKVAGENPVVQACSPAAPPEFRLTTCGWQLDPRRIGDAHYHGAAVVRETDANVRRARGVEHVAF